MNLFKSKTSQHSLITIGTTGINGVLGLLFYIFSARLLGPSDFGNLLIVLAIIVIASDIADFGLNSGIINFVSKNKDTKDYYFYLSSAIQLKLLFGVITVVIISVGSIYLAETVFNKVAINSLLVAGSVGILGQMLFSFSTSTLQALQRFYSWSGLLIGSNLLRLIALFILLNTNQLSAQTVLFSFIVMPFLFFGFSLLLLPSKHILHFSHSQVSTDTLIKFSSWVGITNILWVFLSKADTLLLGRLVSSIQLGIYGIASQLTVVINQLISALAAVLAPRFASFKEKKEMNRFLIKFSFAISGLIILSVFLLPIVYFILPGILGEQYVTSLPIFVVLILAGLLVLLATPLHESIRYFFQRPNVFLYIYGIQLLLTTIFGIYLTNGYGILGMAFAILIGNLSNLLLSFFFYIKLFRS